MRVANLLAALRKGDATTQVREQYYIPALVEEESIKEAG
jgi:hypothetical protein